MATKFFFLSKTCLSLDIMTFFIGKKYIVVKDDLEGGDTHYLLFS